MTPTISKNTKLYYARIMPIVGIFDVLDLTVRTVEDTYFVGIEKREKHAFLFSYKDVNKIVFLSRDEALELVLKAEENSKKISSETYYEDY